MWTWLSENYGVVSAVASVATLCVWLAYLQLFYMSYRHQLRPKIMITRGGGHSMSSRCMLTNMSPEVVFIQAIIIRLRLADREIIRSLSDIERGASESRDQRSELLQGPISSGEYLDLGPFENLVKAALRDRDASGRLEDVEEMTITAVGTYTWNDRPVAAERSFHLRVEGDKTGLQAEEVTARQIRSRRELKRLHQLLEEESKRPSAL